MAYTAAALFSSSEKPIVLWALNSQWQITDAKLNLYHSVLTHSTTAQVVVVCAISRS